ncbi:MAG: hypothetical protein R8P61_04285 [Bacteroidia bacterium]|nr:hypothetical protein [Bacteroidia bacterium]
MKSFIYICLMILPLSLWSQDNNASISLAEGQKQKLTQKRLPPTNIFDIEYLYIDAIQSGSGGNTYEFKLYNTQNNQTKEKKFILRPLTHESFYSAFKHNFKELIKDISDDRLDNYKGDKLDTKKNFQDAQNLDTQKQEIENRFFQEANRIYNYFIGSIRTVQFISLEPKAGDLCFTSEIDIQRTIASSKSKLVKRSLKREFKDLKKDWKLRYEYRDEKAIGKKQIMLLLEKEILDQNQGKSIDSAVLKDSVLKVYLSKESSFKKGVWINKNNMIYTLDGRSLSGKGAIMKGLEEKRQNKEEADADRILIDEKSKLAFFRQKQIKQQRKIDELEEAIEYARKKEQFQALASKNDQRLDSLEYLTYQFFLLVKKNDEKSPTQGKNPGKEIRFDLLNISYTTGGDKFPLDDSDLEEKINDTEDSLEKKESQAEFVNDSLKTELDKINALLKAEEDESVKEEITSNQIKVQQKKDSSENLLKDLKSQIDLLGKAKSIYDKYHIINQRWNDLDDTLGGLELQIDREHPNIRKESLENSENAEIEDSESLRRKCDNLRLNLQKIALSIEKADDRVKKAQKNLVNQRLKIDYAEIEFNDGYIENIQVYGHIVDKNGTKDPKELKLENLSPIGFSRKIDYNHLKSRKLYSRSQNFDVPNYEIYIKDFLNLYRPKLEVDRRDYSPANQVITFKDDNCYELKKSATYKLFEANAFSDFAGLSAGEPNGLIQLEFARRLPLVTYRKPLPKYDKENQGVRREHNFGLFQYVEPSAVIAKFEETERFLQLARRDRIVNGEYRPLLYQSTLNIKQYQIFETGLNLNLFVFDAPAFKSTVYTDAGFRYGITPVRDSIYTLANGIPVASDRFNDISINTFETFLRFSWEVRVDERLRLITSYQPTSIFARTNAFQQVQNLEIFALDGQSKRAAIPFHRIEFLAFYEPPSSGNGRLFFRYRWNWQQGYWNTGFRQLQLGYSFYLMGR